MDRCEAMLKRQSHRAGREQSDTDREISRAGVTWAPPADRAGAVAVPAADRDHE